MQNKEVEKVTAEINKLLKENDMMIVPICQIIAGHITQDVKVIKNPPQEQPSKIITPEIVKPQ